MSIFFLGAMPKGNEAAGRKIKQNVHSGERSPEIL